MKCPHCQDELGLNNICINPACSYFGTTIKSSEKSYLNDTKNNLNNEKSYSNLSDTYNSNTDFNSNNKYDNQNNYRHNKSNYSYNDGINRNTNIYSNNDNISKEEFAAFIGINNTDYYIDHIHKLENNNKFLSWNWSCFFLGPYWLLYRKLYALGAVFIVLAFAFSLLFDSGIPMIMALIIRIIFTMFANSIYLNTCERKIRAIKTAIKNLSTTEYIARLQRKGGVSLVTPLVIIGIYTVIIIISVIIFVSFAIIDNEPNFYSPSYQF